MEKHSGEKSGCSVAVTHTAPEKQRPISSTTAPCVFCGNDHMNFKCQELLKIAAPARKKLVVEHNLCHLCLKQHSTSGCNYKWRCRICKGRHNTLIHTESVVKSNACNSACGALLATARLRLTSPTGRELTIRVLLDQGSMNSFVSEDLVQSLKLTRRSELTVVEGIGGTKIRSKGATTLRFESIFEKGREFSVDALVLSKLVTVPELYFSPPEYLKSLKLADDLYWKGGKVDALFGADVYQDIIMDGIVKSSLLAQKTHIGWILSGRVSSTPSHVTCLSVVASVHSQLQKFWETEEKILDIPPWTEEQCEAEKFFTETTTRDSNGQFVARLPLKRDCALGNSRSAAIGNLFQLEKRFAKSPEFKSRYVIAMNEYFSMGHAVPATSYPGPLHCFLPHLAVIKEGSSTTKTRIVFNASSATSNKRSLNDNLLVGPVVQRDVVENLMRFRLHQRVFICDVEKMYRMIKMNPADWDLQRFVWREHEHENIKDYWLTTVTFGQASAPFTATRSLIQLGIDVAGEFPLATQILSQDAYVDDLHFGAHDVKTLIEGAQQLTLAMSSAAFNLRKWSSNSPMFLSSLDASHINPDNEVKFLGLSWNSTTDWLSFPTLSPVTIEKLTMRQVLSELSSVFDPVGWTQPVIITGKIMMQKFWMLKLTWNDSVPKHMISPWEEIRESFKDIPYLRMPRWINYIPGRPFELHAFCDASERAFGAVIYGKSESSVILLASKSRVAPIHPISIPRLELKSAVLLCELVEKIRKSFSCDDLTLHCYGDSRVALHWISGDITKWKPFIRNRVHFIRQRTKVSEWSYVRSADNPADLVSRGCTAKELRTSSLWWKGPSWLTNKETPHVARKSLSHEELNEIQREQLKTVSLCSAVGCPEENCIDQLLEKFSSRKAVIRIVAWTIRFLRRSSRMSSCTETFITADEFVYAEMKIIVHLQSLQFGDEIERLIAGKPLRIDCKILPLNPFVDDAGVLRVGGRLSKSALPYTQKHPIILGDHPVVNLLITEHHLKTLHGGALLTQSSIRQSIWLVNGTQLVKKQLKKCLVCTRSRPRLLQQLMGDLPTPRVSYTKAFLHTGTDFAGPVVLKGEVGRGSRAYKGYIAVFVCLATKAIHLEVVRSLTTDSFLAAIHRFVARRGPVTHFYSDNGTNNVGVFRKLEKIQEKMAEINLRWSFIPPAAPHFGGLWEAGVRSMKTHLERVLGSACCTYEEMATITSQVEAVLNSRPLCPRSGDVNDLDVITPMHFLTGTQYIPMPDDTELNKTIVKRYEFIQARYHDICQRYKREYLTRLQTRPKWLVSKANIEVGQLVLIKDESLATTKWTLGRVTDTHPGEDGLVRVVTVKTASGSKIRPIAKIAPLPVDSVAP